MTSHADAAGQIQVRRLVMDDADLYRSIRLEALKTSPQAFSSTFESENERPLTWFVDRLVDAAVFGAFRDAALVGTAGLFIQNGEKVAHKGVLWGMYVRPDARRAGIARRLAEAVIDHARQHVELIQLTVVSANAEARRLYAGLGFVEYGIEKNALKEGGRYYDDVLMAKVLAANSN